MKLVIKSKAENSRYSVFHKGVENPRQSILLLSNALVGETIDNLKDKATKSYVKNLLFEIINYVVHETFEEERHGA